MPSFTGREAPSVCSYETYKYKGAYVAMHIKGNHSFNYIFQPLHEVFKNR